MKTYQEIYKEREEQLQKEIANLRNKRVFLNKIENEKVVPMFSYEQFEEILKINIQINLLAKNKKTKYQITKQNEYIIKELYLYLIGSQEFKGDLFKGIYISGNNGTGKTILIKGIIKVIQDFSIKIITHLHSKQVAGYLKEKGDNHLKTRPLYIEDIGKEEVKINDFGTVKMPIIDLFSTRYEYGAWTFCCCNYKLETIEKKYTKTISDRFKDIFNFFELTGESWRGEKNNNLN